MARAAHRRVPRLAQRDQRHRARRRASDPDFRAALAAHGYTLDRRGEIEQLAPFVGPFIPSGRADRPQHRPVRIRLASRAPGRGAGAGAAAGVGRAGLGRGAARTRSYPEPGAGPARPLAAPSWPHSDTATATGRCSSRCRSVGTVDRDARRDRGTHAAGCGAVGVERRRRARRGRTAARRAEVSSPTRRCAPSWPKTSPPAPWPRACRCWTSRRARSTSARSPPSVCSRSRPTWSGGSRCAAPNPLPRRCRDRYSRSDRRRPRSGRGQAAAVAALAGAGRWS